MVKIFLNKKNNYSLNSLCVFIFNLIKGWENNNGHTITLNLIIKFTLIFHKYSML